MTELNCEHMINKIPLLLDNQLPEQEKACLLDHIHSCPTCSMEYDFFCKTKELTETLSAPKLSCGFHDRLMNTIETEAKRPVLRPKKLFYRKTYGFAAAAAVLALSVASYVALQSGFDNGQTGTLTAPVAPHSTEAAITPRAQASTAPEDSKTTPKAGPSIASNAPRQESPAAPAFEQSAKEPPFSAAQIAENPENALLPAVTDDEKTPDCKVYRVFVDQWALPLAEEKMQGFTKEENGYRVETAVAPLLSELATLSGYRVEEAASENENTYIQLSTNQ